jgi:hypothetical protein
LIWESSRPFTLVAGITFVSVAEIAQVATFDLLVYIFQVPEKFARRNFREH